MVIAMDQAHAKAIAELMRTRLGVRATVATSDDREASQRIAEFAAGDSPWIVAVRMVSEGVDIPRLRVGVYATNTSTDLFFRQAVGRLVRWTAGSVGQKAYMFIPDDPRIRRFALGIRDQRRHSLRKEESADKDELDSGDDPADSPGGDDEQLSLFAVISAIPLDEAGQPLQSSTIVDNEVEECFGDPDPAPPGDRMQLPTVEADFRLESMVEAPLVEEALLPPPALLPPDLTNRERKKQLRSQNASRAQELSRRIGMTHAEVNAELNRRTGIRRITEATQHQLAHRIRVAEAWLRRI